MRTAQSISGKGPERRPEAFRRKPGNRARITEKKK
jgi:hypothetical protein